MSKVLARTRVSTNYGARHLEFVKGKFYETFQVCCGARKEKREIEIGQAAQLIIHWQHNLLCNPQTESFTHIDERLIGCQYAPEVISRLCDIYKIAA